MKILILTEGTRGDNEPYVALGRGLIDRGHDVLLCNSILRQALKDSNFDDDDPSDDSNSIENFDNDVIAKKIGVPFCDYGTNDELKNGLKNFMENLYIPLEMGEESKKTWKISMENMYAVCRQTRYGRAKQMLEIAEQFKPDLIVQGVIYCDALSIGEKLGIPVVRNLLWPALPTNEFPLLKHEAYVDNTTWEDAISSVDNPIETYDDSILCWEKNYEVLNKRRNEIFKLKSLSEKEFRDYYLKVPTLIGYSSKLYPIPEDWKNAYFTGFWKLKDKIDDNNYIDKKLEAFIEDGEKPVYMGWGSVPIQWVGREPKWIAELVIRSLMKAKKRGVILKGVSNIDLSSLIQEEIPDYNILKDYADKNIMFISSAPHTWLFPKCSVIIHHGGVGTTTTALMSSVPQLITTVSFDNFIIAANIQRINAGIKMPFLSACTPEILSDAIIKITSDKKFIEGANLAGEQVTKECSNSIKLAVDRIEKIKADYQFPWKLK